MTELGAWHPVDAQCVHSCIDSTFQASTPSPFPTHIPLGYERQWMEGGSPLTSAEGSGQIPVWLQQVLG